MALRRREKIPDSFALTARPYFPFKSRENKMKIGF